MTAPYDKLAGDLAAAGLKAKSLLAPRCLRRFTHTVTTTVTTTMRVIGGVHNDTTDRWALTQVAAAAGFTDFDVLVLLVADNTERSRTVFINKADFAARQANLGIAVIAAHQLGAVAGAADHLGAAAKLHLNSVNGAADRDILKWQAVAGFDSSFFATDDRLADFHTLGSQDVVVGAVRFFDTGDAGAAVRIVFDVLDGGGCAVEPA